MKAVGDSITIRGISQKGKNRVREHGNSWKIIRSEETVTIFVGLGNTPGFLLEAPDGYWRWMRKEDDADFEVVG